MFCRSPDAWLLNDFAMFLRTTVLKPEKNNFTDADIEQLAEIYDQITTSMLPLIASACADEGKRVLQDVESASAQLNEFLPDVIRAFEAHGEAFRSERHCWGMRENLMDFGLVPVLVAAESPLLSDHEEGAAKDSGHF